MTTRRSPLASPTLAALSAILITAPASAAWPETPEESVLIGIAEGTFFGTRQALAAAGEETWIAWQDSFCGGFDGGAVRLNRLDLDGVLLEAGGVGIQPDTTCGFAIPPLLAPLENGIAATRGQSDLSTEPLNAYATDATPLWGPGFTTTSAQSLQRIATLPSGDLIAASANFSTIRLDRLDPTGAPVWDAPSLIPSPSGSNFDIRGIIPAADGGFFLVWDSPLSYTRQAFVLRLDAQGAPLWDQPVVPMQNAPQPGISRHTQPVAVPTTGGRLMYIWTQGFEQSTTPAPIRYQIINPDGSLTFPIEGARLTDSPERQFDPIALRDEETGEISIVFRAGLFDTQSIRAQRLDAEGDRLWNNAGITVTDIPVSSPFDADLLNGELHTLSIAPADAGGLLLNAHQVTDTQSVRGPWTAARTQSLFSIVAIENEGGLIATWQEDGPMTDDTLHATRINPAGRLGAPPCNEADIAAPYYILDLADVQAFIPSFLNSAPEADLANPSGILDLADVQAFIDSFSGGCF